MMLATHNTLEIRYVANFHEGDLAKANSGRYKLEAGISIG